MTASSSNPRPSDWSSNRPQLGTRRPRRPLRRQLQRFQRHAPRPPHGPPLQADTNSKRQGQRNRRWRGRPRPLGAAAQHGHHPGLQLLDVVELADSRITLAATSYRVLSLALDYSRGSGSAYNAIIELGAL